MCGIAGVVAFDGVPADNSLAGRLSAALAHRGPDGEGTFASPHALLVHRRLAIIDPTPRGAQPMSWAEGRYQIVFNGEIYNYRELRSALESHGETFRTESDTEVLLRLVVREGPDALARLRGMFAFAIWDERDRVLLVARDRFGIKPLYVTTQQGRVAFASEIGALRRVGLVERRVSAEGVLAYLSWASIPAPLTWLEGVEQLDPGTWMRVSPSGAARGRFAHVPHAFATNGSQPVSERELRQRTREAIRDSVGAHLVADVPVGIFLSGGIDSSALVSAARSVTQSELHTYTVVVDDVRYSEEAPARLVAERFGTTHHSLRVDPSTLATDLPAILQRLDQPTADAINTFYVSRAVASTSVKAVLSGVGGDELFCGYPSFRRLPAALRASRMFGRSLRWTRPAAAAALPHWRAVKWAQFAEQPTLDRGYRALRGLFMPDEVAAMSGPALLDRRLAAQTAVADVESRWLRAGGEETPLGAVARLETRGFLASQLLRDIDAMSMAHGLEVRVPFVDHELLEAVWPALGHHPTLALGKRLLRESLDEPLPDAILSRPKQGFTLPFDAWMRAGLRDATQHGLDALVRQQWVSKAATDHVREAWERGDAHWSRVWGLSMLGRFLEEAP